MLVFTVPPERRSAFREWCRPQTLRLLESTPRLIRPDRSCHRAAWLPGTLAGVDAGRAGVNRGCDSGGRIRTTRRRTAAAVVVDELALVRLGLITSWSSALGEPGGARIGVVGDAAGGREGAELVPGRTAPTWS